MMIKHDKIKAGDRVQIANGDWFKVYRNGFQLQVFEGEDADYNTYVDRNLITAHRPAFDWKDAKSGMCFKYDGVEHWYIGKDFSDKYFVVVSTVCNGVDEGNLAVLDKEYLTRHPEGDVILEENE